MNVALCTAAKEYHELNKDILSSINVLLNKHPDIF